MEGNIIFLTIGIDHFKAVIDEFNYDIGDKVLIELAKVIYKNISKKDIVARLIGDEFLVALINLDDLLSYDNIAQKIIDDFSKVEVIVDEETQQVLKKTVCIGISSYPQDSNNISEVLKYSDAFLYEAKNKGRGQMAIYVEEDNSSIDLF
jgi:diguanylate cyclase (GGDEF)-like protein